MEPRARAQGRPVPTARAHAARSLRELEAERAAIEIPRSGSAEILVEGQRVQLTGLDRMMWPVAGLTKADLLDYYLHVAPVLLPHVAGRPLRAVRFPDGVHLRGVVDSDLAPLAGVASLIEAADLAAVEIHVPLGPPSCVLFEVDPGAGRTLKDCCVVALHLRTLLAEDGLVSHVKTSGAFGLHVAVPLNGGAGDVAARQYALGVAERMAATDPDLVTSDARRAQRVQRVLVDWRPNVPGRAIVAPYSLRAMLPGPGVSAPVRWADVEAGADGEMAALHRSPHEVLAAVTAGEDLWRLVLESVQPLPSRH